MSNKAERLPYLFLFQHSSPRAGLGSHSLHSVLKFRGIRKVELVWAQQNRRRLEKRTWIFSQLPCSFTGLQNQFQLQHHLCNSLVFRWCPVLHPQGQGEVCSHRDEGKASDRQEAKGKAHSWGINGPSFSSGILWLVQFLGVLQQCSNPVFNVDSVLNFQVLACARYHGALAVNSDLISKAPLYVEFLKSP